MCPPPTQYNNNNTIKSSDSRVRLLVEATFLFTSKNGTEPSFGGEPKNTSTSCVSFNGKGVAEKERGTEPRENAHVKEFLCVMRM